MGAQFIITYKNEFIKTFSLQMYVHGASEEKKSFELWKEIGEVGVECNSNTYIEVPESWNFDVKNE